MISRLGVLFMHFVARLPLPWVRAGGLWFGRFQSYLLRAAQHACSEMKCSIPTGHSAWARQE